MFKTYVLEMPNRLNSAADLNAWLQNMPEFYHDLYRCGDDLWRVERFKIRPNEWRYALHLWNGQKFEYRWYVEVSNVV
jgi:hypothetical protein